MFYYRKKKKNFRNRIESCFYGAVGGECEGMIIIILIISIF